MIGVGRGRAFRIVVGAASVLALALGIGTPAAHPRGASTGYTDAAGESGAAPDVRHVSVDAQGGRLTFSFQVDGFPGRQLALGVFDRVFVCVDADRNWSTGSTGGGCDYGFWLLRSSAPGESLFFAKWTAAGWVTKQNPADVTVDDTPDGFTVAFPASKIGSRSTFDFYVESDLIKEDGLGHGPLATDALPDHGWLTFPQPQPGAPDPQKGSAVFDDPVGDGRREVDLSNITVADGPNAAIRIGFTVKGLKEGGLVDVDVDADENPRTGHGGRDVSIEFSDEPGLGWGYELYRWAGGSWQYVDSGDSAVSGPGTTVTTTVPRHDLGGSSGFDFYVLARNFDARGTTSGRDDAPDASWWRYTPVGLSGDQLVRPVIGSPRVSSRAPVAGHVWTITFPVTRSDDRKAFAVNGVSGDGVSLGGSFFPAEPRVGSGFVRWTIKVPKSARGKLLRFAFGAFDATQVAYTARQYRVR